MLTPSSAMKAGPVVSLGTVDSVTVGQDVAIVSTSGTAITGTGSDQAAIIAGTVASQTFGIVIGTTGSSSGNSVSVGAAGRVFGFDINGGAIFCYGTEASVVNQGHVEGGSYGVGLYGNSDTTSSTVTNSGVIKAQSLAVFRDGTATTETIVLKNSGLIESGDMAYGHYGDNHTGKDLITNTGTMIGDISTEGGDDKYDGRKGTLEGNVSTGAGNDQVLGGKEDNVFDGGAGQDRLSGGLGADMLTGGLDADTFVYRSVKDSALKPEGRDTIVGFNQIETDQIDLKAIDADTRTAGNQKFDFIGDAAFGGEAGELRFLVSAGNTLIQGDVNGDKKADFSILLDAEVMLGAGDFIL